MQNPSQWPAPLLRKWLLLALIGLGCPAIGLVMLILNGDMMLFVMSMILALFTACRCAILYRRICREEYDVIEGVCLSTKWVPLQRKRTLYLMTDTGEKRTMVLPNKLVPGIGRRYRVYLLDAPVQAQSSPALRDLGHLNAFAVEDLGVDQEVTE